MNCTIQKLLVLCTSKNDFALFHMNVRSLSLHFDELVSNLASLNINFDVIGMSETWNSFANSVKMNFEIPQICYFPCQTHSQNGGLALYLNSSLIPTSRTDLGMDSTNFEAVWVEVENKNGRIYLFCCLYRHPISYLDNVNEYLQEILSNPAVKNKSLSLVTSMSIF